MKNDKKEFDEKTSEKGAGKFVANGGLSCTLFYGVLIAGISLTAIFKAAMEVLTRKETQL